MSPHTTRKTSRRLLTFAVILFAVASSLLAEKPVQGGASERNAMGSAPCVWGVPLRGPHDALDVSATIHVLSGNRFDCTVLVIGSHPPNSLADFERLLPAAQAAGISVWPVLIPPTEGGNSLPYKTDFVAWMRALAQLSLKYPALRGVNIDDLLVGQNTQLFTHTDLCNLYQTKQRINSKLLFAPTIYDLGPEETSRLEGCVDGVWLWWVNLEKTDGWRSLLEDSKAVVGNRFPIYGGVYAHSTSWHREGAPSPKLLRQTLEIACRYSDGAVIWNLPLAPDSASNPLLATARSFAPGGSDALAGKCGQVNGRSPTQLQNGAKK